MIKILLIEDDTNLAFMLTDGLESEGFEVHHITHGEEAMSVLAQYLPAIILLDVNLKGSMTGFEVSKIIRQSSNIPIIFTTSRTQFEDLQEGFRIGNVDYVKKPYSIRELKLRIDELLSRNAAPMQMQTTTPTDQPIQLGNILFIASEHCLQMGEEHIRLQKNECAVLLLLYENREKVLSKQEILENVWEEKELLLREASLYNILSSLRLKLNSDPRISIQTIPKLGYKLTLNK